MCINESTVMDCKVDSGSCFLGNYKVKINVACYAQKLYIKLFIGAGN